MQTLTVFFKTTVECKIGHFVRVFVEVVHQPGLTFENGVFPAIGSDNATPGSLAIATISIAPAGTDDLEISGVDIGDGCVSAKIAGIVGALKCVRYFSIAKAKRGRANVYVIN